MPSLFTFARRLFRDICVVVKKLRDCLDTKDLFRTDSVVMCIVLISDLKQLSQKTQLLNQFTDSQSRNAKLTRVCQ